ncbi:MAG: ATP-dependent chaperone ClpB [Candidatus Daviesbacteria bacterium GW2011_GWA2_42_7]|nr:MAG: ATP-dependent chaperone ClpB [Candidatus Daviesbacteria bacterium GW2011_GWA2_42_7]
MDQLKKEVGDELLAIFKPELINRFDEVVLFKPLTPQDLQKIVNLKLTELQNQLKEQGYLVEFDGGVAQKLAERGFDPVLGARPLRRLIQDTLEARLSVMILEGKLHKGGKVIFDFDFKER